MDEKTHSYSDGVGLVRYASYFQERKKNDERAWICTQITHTYSQTCKRSRTYSFTYVHERIFTLTYQAYTQTRAHTHSKKNVYFISTVADGALKVIENKRHSNRDEKENDGERSIEIE